MMLDLPLNTNQTINTLTTEDMNQKFEEFFFLIIHGLCYRMIEEIPESFPKAIKFILGLCKTNFLENVISFLNETQFSSLRTLEHVQIKLPSSIPHTTNISQENFINDIRMNCYDFTTHLLTGRISDSIPQNEEILAMGSKKDPYEIWIRCTNKMLGFLNQVFYNIDHHISMPFDPPPLSPLFSTPKIDVAFNIAAKLLALVTLQNKKVSYTAHVLSTGEKTLYGFKVNFGERTYDWLMREYNDVNTLCNFLHHNLKNPSSEEQSGLTALKNYLNYSPLLVQQPKTTPTSTSTTPTERVPLGSVFENEEGMKTAKTIFRHTCVRMMLVVREVHPSFKGVSLDDNAQKCSEELYDQLPTDKNSLRTGTVENNTTLLFNRPDFNAVQKEQVIKNAVNKPCFDLIGKLMTEEQDALMGTTDKAVSIAPFEKSCRETLLTIINMLSLAIPEPSEPKKRRDLTTTHPSSFFKAPLKQTDSFNPRTVTKSSSTKRQKGQINQPRR